MIESKTKKGIGPQFQGSEWKFKRNKLKWKYSEKLSMCGIFFEKGKEFTDTFSAFDEPKVESFTRCFNINVCKQIKLFL